MLAERCLHTEPAVRCLHSVQVVRRSGTVSAVRFSYYSQYWLLKPLMYLIKYYACETKYIVSLLAIYVYVPVSSHVFDTKIDLLNNASPVRFCGY